VLLNVDEIDSRCQLHQCFFARFFHTKSLFLADFFSYVLALAKNLHKKFSRKMLMKLTPEVLLEIVFQRTDSTQFN